MTWLFLMIIRAGRLKDRRLSRKLFPRMAK